MPFLTQNALCIKPGFLVILNRFRSLNEQASGDIKMFQNFENLMIQKAIDLISFIQQE